MSEQKGIVNVDAGGISEVGKALIEKVADAIGWLYKPHQIVRIAKAQAKADIIKAQADLEVEALQRRALERFVAEEAKKQANIEQITAKAVPLLEDQSEPEKMEDDWIANFFDKSRIVSDDEMQDLWARILAGEVNAPGKFSKRTVNLLADLDKNDANLFKKLCGFGWMINRVTLLVFNQKAEIYNNMGINFESLSHLESTGLIQCNYITDFMLDGLPDAFPIFYYGKRLVLKRQEGARTQLKTGKVILTNAGRQLAEISGSISIPDFYEYVVDEFTKQKYIPSP
jgi:hypothetical protein